MKDFDEDIQLMLRFQDGDESCFERLVERYKQRVFSLAYRFLGNYQEAEDVTQELFISVYHAANRYRPTAKVITWFYTMCRNECIKRSGKKSTEVSLSDYDEYSENPISLQVEDMHTPCPLESMLAEERALIVKEAFDSLPERQRFAVILYRYGLLSYEEIAEVMSCSVTAVKSLLHRARMNLKEKLKDYLEKR